jgi:hypothetical protein
MVVVASAMPLHGSGVRMKSPNGSMPIRSTAMLYHAKAMLNQRLILVRVSYFGSMIYSQASVLC